MYNYIDVVKRNNEINGNNYHWNSSSTISNIGDSDDYNSPYHRENCEKE